MADEFKCLTYVNLPYSEVRKAPGDTVTRTELEEAGQSEDSIQELVDNGVISEDMDAELHPDHQPVVTDAVAPSDENDTPVEVSSNDAGEGASSNV